MERARRIQPNAIIIQEHIIGVHRTMQEVFIETGSVDQFFTFIGNLIRIQASVGMEIRENTSMLASHSLANLSNATIPYQEANFKLYEARANMNQLLRLVSQQQNQSYEVDIKYQDLDVFNETLQLNGVNTLFNYLYNQCESSSNTSTLTSEVAMILSSISMADNLLTLSDMTIAHSQSLLIWAEGDISVLKEALNFSSNLPTGDTSGSGDLASGSGVTPEELVPSSVSVGDIISRISSLQLSFDHISSLLVYHEEEVRGVAGITVLLEAALSLNK